MHTHYDIETNIATLEFGSGKIVRAREFGNLIVHLSSAGKPVLIEILDASNFKTKPVKIASIESLGQAVGS